MSWFYLIIAGLLEVAWASGLKYTHGFTRPIPSLLTALAIVGSMVLLALAQKHLPIGTAYGVWVAIGVVGVTIIGIALQGDPATPMRLAFLALLVVAVVGLKFTGGEG